MSGEGKRVGSSRFRYRALPRLYGGETGNSTISNCLAGLVGSPPPSREQTWLATSPIFNLMALRPSLSGRQGVNRRSARTDRKNAVPEGEEEIGQRARQFRDNFEGELLTRCPYPSSPPEAYQQRINVVRIAAARAAITNAKRTLSEGRFTASIPHKNTKPKLPVTAGAALHAMLADGHHHPQRLPGCR